MAKFGPPSRPRRNVPPLQQPKPQMPTVFYWSYTQHGEPIASASTADLVTALARGVGQTSQAKLRTYRTFNTEFEARMFAAAFDGEFRTTTLPARFAEAYIPANVEVKPQGSP